MRHEAHASGPGADPPLGPSSPTGAPVPSDPSLDEVLAPPIPSPPTPLDAPLGPSDPRSGVAGPPPRTPPPPRPSTPLDAPLGPVPPRAGEPPGGSAAPD